MPLYFAYGANMDVSAMSARAPGARPLGLARLVRHRFAITEHGYASILRDPRATVHGLLWEVPLADIRALDRFEEVDRGLYAKIAQPVITASGPRRALVYAGTGKPGGKPRAGYLEDVIRAGAEIGLPSGYLKEIATLGQGASAAPSRKSVSGPRASETWSWGD